ncbi:hypothetical protein JTF08_15850 [Micrococcaceae bacterium RIT802]|nr:hypothetical protein [Micrococcaceae bacterium RIT 802]
MRIIIAAISILLGAVALVVGIGQRTFWAPPEIATATVQTELKDAPVTVIGPGVAENQDRPVDVTIEADGEFTAALGRSADVDAWVGKAAHNTISGINSETMALDAEHANGESKVPNPKDSDLWVASESADSHLVHRWTQPADGDWSLLLAADGSKAAPTHITVSWENDASTPFSIPLIIVGALLIVFGAASLLVTGRGRGKGPQGPAATGPGSGSRSAAPATGSGSGSTALQRTAAVAAAAALVLVPAMPASAAPADSPSGSAADPTDTDQDVYAVVQESQLNRILESVSDSVSAGDKAKDAKKLDARVGGKALDLRKHNYAQRGDGVKIAAPDPVAAGPVRSAAVTTTTDWPRTLMVVTQAKDAKVPEVLVLKQDNPRANYKLVNSVTMLPGSEFPGIGVGDTSVRTLSTKDDSVAVAPETAAKDLAEYLGNSKSKKKGEFDKSPFISATHDGQAAAIKDNKNAKIKYKHRADVKSLNVLSTPNGGALVSGYLTSTMSATPKEEGGTVKLDAVSAKLAGASSTKEGVDINYAEPVVFYIPADDSKDKIRLVAGESMPLSAKLK